jgi:hypothetical protein
VEALQVVLVLRVYASFAWAENPLYKGPVHRRNRVNPIAPIMAAYWIQEISRGDGT